MQRQVVSFVNFKGFWDQVLMSLRVVGWNFIRGVVLNVTFQKGYFCTDLFPNTLYRKYIRFAPKKIGGGAGGSRSRKLGEYNQKFEKSHSI